MNDMTGLFMLLLLAVLVGAAIPVLYQVVQTLKSTRQFIDTTGRRLDEALREFTAATARINRIAATIEEEGQRLRPAIDAAASIGKTVERVRDSVRTASVAMTALAPAFLAGMRAFMDRGGDSATGPAAGEAAGRGAADPAGGHRGQ
jgi:uncharacterized protein YoxC